MTIFLGTDHAGFELKESIKNFLGSAGYKIEDCGAYEFNREDDYPDFVSIAAQSVVKNPDSFGIVFGYSGAGECIAANKIAGARAVLGVSEENITLARQHNDANVLSLGSHFTDRSLAKKLVQLFLNTPFSGEERHVRRLEKISRLEHHA